MGQENIFVGSDHFMTILFDLKKMNWKIFKGILCKIQRSGNLNETMPSHCGIENIIGTGLETRLYGCKYINLFYL